MFQFMGKEEQEMIELKLQRQLEVYNRPHT